MDALRQLISKNVVIVFSKSYCRLSRRVKDILEKENIMFHAVELDLLGAEERSIQEALYEITNQISTPNVFLHGQHVGGCGAAEKLFRDGTLRERALGTYENRDFDLVIVGGGSGGLAAAKEAAYFGRRVAICDFVTPSPRGMKWGLGVNVGYVPKKLMHRAATFGYGNKDSSDFGWKMPGKTQHSWNKIVQEVKRHIMSLNFERRSELCMVQKIVYFNALATFVSDHKLKLIDSDNKMKEITMDNAIVAVGSRPKYPDIPGAKEYGITSDDVFDLPHCPGKTLVIGGSSVSLECAGFISGFDLDVTVMVRSILLRGFDRQMVDEIGSHMASQGIKFLKGVVPIKIVEKSQGSPGELTVTYKMPDGKEEEQTFNTVMFAIGRRPCTQNIGLQEIGVELNESNGKIIADEFERTKVKNVFAIGDVLDGTRELTPAIQAGRLLAKRLYGKNNNTMDYRMIPTTLFTPLEYGSVGYSEEDAIKTFGESEIEVYHMHFQPLEFTLLESDKNIRYGKLVCLKFKEGLITAISRARNHFCGEILSKLTTSRNLNRVIGIHILGPNAGEMTHGFELIIMVGANKADFVYLASIHPTYAKVFATMSITKSSGPGA